MRHPTLALVLLSFATGSLLHCELGIPAWADDSKVIEVPCEDVELAPGWTRSRATLSDGRVNPTSVLDVRLCDRTCPERESGQCGCDFDDATCASEAWKERCYPASIWDKGFVVMPGQIRISCDTGDSVSKFGQALVLLR